MRFIVALAALVIAAPAEAKSAPCIAHSHKGAIPYDLGFDDAAPRPADFSHGSGNPAGTDAEVAGIDRDTHGQLWVYRVHEFAWKREDVDLRGDCRRAMAP